MLAQIGPVYTPDPIMRHPLNEGMNACWLGLPELTGGQNLYDIAHNHDGVFTNSPTWGGYLFGLGMVSFLGTSSQYVRVAGGGHLNNLQRGSIVARCRWRGTQDTGFGGAAGSLCGRQKDGSFSNQLITLSGSNPATATCRWHAYGTSVSAGGATAVGDGTWRTIGVSYASGSHRLYLDGKQDGAGTGTGTIQNDTTIPLSIGGWLGTGSSYMTGDVAFFAVFDRFLDASEHQAWHNDILEGFRHTLQRRQWSPSTWYEEAPAPPAATGGAGGARRRKKVKPIPPVEAPSKRDEPVYDFDHPQPQPDICPLCQTDLHLYNRLRREAGLIEEKNRKLRLRVKRLIEKLQREHAERHEAARAKPPVQPNVMGMRHDDDELIRMMLGWNFE